MKKLLAALLLAGTLCGTQAPLRAQPYVWGLTTDNCAGRTTAQVNALKDLPSRTMLRTVFDLPSDGVSAADYVPCIKALSAVVDIMGQPLDSSYMKGTSLAATKSRMDEYLNTLGAYVNIWEVGNEVNGNWLGSDVMLKIEAMYDKAREKSKRTAITFYYEPTPSASGTDMIPWIDKYIPAGHRIRSGLNYALVSYYEDQNNGYVLTEAEIDEIFAALAARFPNAQVGFGEFGWGNRVPDDPAKRAAMLNRFYSYRVPSVPAFVGGGFYWHFHQTMLGASPNPDREVMKALMLGE